jgi:hypothetical protein
MGFCIVSLRSNTLLPPPAGELSKLSVPPIPTFLEFNNVFTSPVASSNNISSPTSVEAADASNTKPPDSSDVKIKTTLSY